MRWDLFCRVIDNFGDVGVAWRLASDLRARGETVRLWLDDASALAWMAPERGGVEVLDWNAVPEELGDAVIEMFGCQLPDAILQRMAQRPPRWINLEYLSAEDYVERSHGLASPQFSGPAQGLAKNFFYPGFTSRTGGLLREPGLLDEPAGLPAGFERREGERLVSLFAYPQANVQALVNLLADAPTLILASPGHFARPQLPRAVRWHDLPYLTQPAYDCLLRACDLNCVRGEDSFVRAQWAGKPFLWQIYFQDDGAHGPKLEAFLARYQPDETTAALFRAWNELGDWPAAPPSLDASHALAWRSQLAIQPDLTSQLLGFVGKSG
ncbi:MAG: elongation factor P maturation arginine rhamnosyltransferase EarP [Paucibacter sp.]|nr:elongation factor P maturation arginine rhamnosyltransferase EarP [Roseateles sp.]